MSVDALMQGIAAEFQALKRRASLYPEETPELNKEMDNLRVKLINILVPPGSER